MSPALGTTSVMPVVLLFSFTSFGRRFTSSTHAVTVCVPFVALQ